MIDLVHLEHVTKGPGPYNLDQVIVDGPGTLGACDQWPWVIHICTRVIVDHRPGTSCACDKRSWVMQLGPCVH